jgi:hypothetical protein
MNGTNGAFDWGSLGEARWRELGESAGASELQIKFACARFGGATATGAARLAGYSGSNDALRRAGYSAVRSTAVQNLLELAAINAPGDAKISDREIDAKLAKLVRSPDAGVSLKAMELHAKRERERKAELASQEETEVDPDVVDADLICAIPVGGIGAAICLGFHYNRNNHRRIANFKFLQEVAPLVSRRFPENWARWRVAYCEHHTLKKELDFIDGCSRGPLLEADALIAAVRAKCPGMTVVRKPKETSTDEMANAN